MRRLYILFTLMLIGATFVSAQNEATADSLDPVLTPSTSPSFYEPPDLSRHWDEARQQVQTMGADSLRPSDVISIIDELEQQVSLGVDSLVTRVRAFEGKANGGYTHKYFTSPMTRDRILGNEISSRTAKLVPHFHAIYGPMGHLLRVRYIEPSRWRTRQKALAEGDFQPAAGAVPLVRYFRQWELRDRKGSDYIKKKKRQEGKPHYRALYDDSDVMTEVQRYDENWKLVYTIDYSRPAEEGNKYSELNFAGDGSGSLLTIHPFLFVGQYSLVKPDWTVAITSDENGELASVQVFNNYDLLTYFYTYSSTVDEETKKRTVRATALSPEGDISQVYSIIYDKKSRMERQVFYTEDGEILHSVTFTYRRRSNRVLAVTRNAVGIVTGQHTIVDPTYAD